MAAGRPRSFCTEKALDSAMQVFWRKGYEGTSMVDLTEAIGINSPSLYAAFGSKDGLFRAVLERYDARRATFMVSVNPIPGSACTYPGNQRRKPKLRTVTIRTQATSPATIPAAFRSICLLPISLIKLI